MGPNRERRHPETFRCQHLAALIIYLLQRVSCGLVHGEVYIECGGNRIVGDIVMCWSNSTTRNNITIFSDQI